ncbi:hypothetical protein PG991_014746 [Apiospora marii]|uniref:F-box domain-containing protein n=1 Tax=Apiospora marii TaxID=335849 RepID=A0ABR1R4D8_9PEZI
MSSIMEFPPEIIGIIFDLLSTAEFHALCRVNKRLRAVAEPRLYSELSCTWSFTWPKAPPAPYPVNTRVPPLIPFLRTITRRPELAALVRTIDLRCGSFNTHAAACHYEEKPALPMLGVDVSGLVDLVGRFPVPYAACWTEELLRGETAAFVALLLALTPNLRHLRMDEEYVPDIWINAAWNMACGSWEDLGALLSQTGGRMDFLTMFYLPAAKDILKLPADESTPGSRSLTRQASPEDILSLNLTMYTKNYAYRILSMMKNLQTLRWRWPRKSKFNDEYDEMQVCFKLDDVVKCVTLVRETLTDLAITVAHVQMALGHHYDTAVTRGSMEELSGFPQLRSLEVPLIFLTRSFTPHGLQPIGQSLPPSLESLTILDTASFGPYEWEDSPDDSPFDPVEAWLRDWRASTPRLSRVRLLLEETERRDWGATLVDNDDEELSARFGLRFEVVRIIDETT